MRLRLAFKNVPTLSKCHLFLVIYLILPSILLLNILDTFKMSSFPSQLNIKYNELVLRIIVPIFAQMRIKKLNKNLKTCVFAFEGTTSYQLIAKRSLIYKGEFKVRSKQALLHVIFPIN